MYKIILATRYLLKRRISYFAVAAVALSVFVVFVVITVLSGISANFKNYVHQSTGDCVIHSNSLVGFGYYEEFLDILRQQQFVLAATPVIKNYALISIVDSKGLPVYGDYTREIIGIEPVTYSKVTAFEDWIVYHNDISRVFAPPYDQNLPGCVPGIDFLFDRDRHGRYPEPSAPVAATFEISCIPLTAKGALAKAGAGEFNSKVFYYSDHFHCGYSMDWRQFYLPFDDAQLLCGMTTGHKRINAIHIKFAPGTSLQAGCRKVKALWNDFVTSKENAPYINLLKAVRVQGWKEYSRVMVALVESQQTMMIFCFAMVGLIIVFIVLVVFYMIVTHKTKDIGILKSLGASAGGIVSLFLYFAVLIGVVGSAIGAFIGWRFLIHINAIEDWLFEHFNFQLWDRRISSIGDIPNQVKPEVLGIIITCAIAACVLGAILPCYRASKTKCVDTLQVGGL